MRAAVHSGGLRGQFGELRRAKLPFLVLWVGWATVVACFSGGSFMGFQISGLAWVVTLVLALMILLRRASSISFPWWVWLPWATLVIVYYSLSHYESALQRTVMLLCPLVVGLAASSYRIAAEKIVGLHLLMRFIAVALWVMVVVNTGLLLTGRLPASTGLSPQAMTACLLACYFVAEYANGNRQALRWWAGLALVPVIALTRTAIVACAATLPATFAKLKLGKRILFGGLILAAMLAVFYTPRVQEKMFRSGHGGIEDLSMDNPNLQTSGRLAIWDAMEARIRLKPWFGYGANASEAFVVSLTGGLTHPHNDWLRLRYDYGYVGTGIFALCMLMQVLNLLILARRATGDVRTLLYAGASSFLPFVMIMYTDNIILYCAFFGNLQFALMGMGYSAMRGVRKAKRREGMARTSTAGPMMVNGAPRAAFRSSE
ncbi:MAG: O-antigen ligase family protein [Acidobacteriota bacterium]